MMEVTSPLGQFWCFPIQEEKNEEVKKSARELGNSKKSFFFSPQDVTLIDEMDYANAETVPSLSIKYKPNTTLRPYQRFAVSRVFWNKSQAHSGVLVLPCGAGKTLIGLFMKILELTVHSGISVMAAIKKSTIIFCFSNLALNQWKEQIEKWTFVNKHELCRFSSQHESEWNER